MLYASLFADKATHSQCYCCPQFIHQICKITLKKVRGGGVCNQIRTNMHATAGGLLLGYFGFVSYEILIKTNKTFLKRMVKRMVALSGLLCLKKRLIKLISQTKKYFFFVNSPNSGTYIHIKTSKGSRVASPRSPNHGRGSSRKT
uniref:Uncharacterized protein n=1 Tax=Glossina austeni TaxID=7395 RepID=A0A1A9ULT6_GLOAU